MKANKQFSKNNHKHPKTKMLKKARVPLSGLQTPALALLVVAVLLMGVGMASLKGDHKALAATNSNINFQARLMSNAGAIVSDGFYNVEFKIYTASAADGGETPIAGSCTTNPGAVADEDCVWFERYYDSNGGTAGNDNRVRVVNGYLTVSLGSQTAFASTINWDQDLWIAMNIGGTTQTATPTWDGEMTPRLKLTAVPYAFRAGQLAKLGGGNTAVLEFDSSFAQPTTITLPDPGGAGTATVCYQASTACGFALSGTGSFIQNGTTIQTNANFAIRSASTSAVGGVIQGASGQTADLLQLQSWNGTTATTVFSVNNDGVLSLFGGQTADITTPSSASTATAITLQPGGSAGAIVATGPAINIRGGDVSGTTSVTGGNVSIRGGNATGGSGTRNGGSVFINPGTGFNSYGSVNIATTANATNTVNIGNSTLSTGTQTINIGNANTAGGTTNVVIGNSSSATAGATTVQAKDAVTITAGAASTWSTTGGALTIQGAGGLNLNTADSTAASTSAVTIRSGNASVGSNLNAGTVSIDTGTQTGSGTASLNLGTTNARAITLGHTGANTSVSIQGGNGINIGTGGVANTIQIGNTSGAVTQTINIGTNATASSTNNVTIGSTLTTGVVTLQGTTRLSTLGNATSNSGAVCRDTTTGDLTFCDANTGGTAFIQGGNTFGAPGRLGTNDTQNLEIETDNVLRATFTTSNSLYLGNGLTHATPSNFTVASTGSSAAGTAGATLTIQGGAGASATTGSAGGGVTIQAGNAGGTNANAGGNVLLQGGSATGAGTIGRVIIRNTTDSLQSLDVETVGSDNVFTVDTVNGRAGINLGGSNTPTSTLQVNGTLRLTSSAVENFSTPGAVPASLPTRLTIGMTDPGNNGHIIAVGLESGSQSNARVITAYDARAGVHHPSIGVASVNEGDILGFSWDGSSTIGKLKTLDRTGGTNASAIHITPGASVSGAGGGISLIGGGGGTSGTGGAVSIQGGTGGSSSGAGGSVSVSTANSSVVSTATITIQSGSASVGSNLNAGTVTIDTGTQTGTGTAILNLGATNARTINIGNSSATVNVGSLTTNGAVYVNGTALASETNLSVTRGGTGIGTTTAYGLLAGGTSATGSFQNVGTGNSGDILRSNGNSALPSWVTATASNLCSDCIVQVPGTTAQNTIAPTAASVVALTVKGTTGTSARVLEIYDSTATPALQAYFDAAGSLNVSQLIQPTANNTIDLGTSSATFRTGYFGTSVVSPTYTGAGAVNVISGGTGALTLNTQSSTSVSTAGITIQSGSASVGSNLNAGTIAIDTGTQTGSGTASINIGTANARAIQVGHTGANASVAISGGTGATAVSLQAAATGTILVGTVNATPVSIGNASSTVTLTGSVRVATLAAVAANSATVCREATNGALTACDSTNTTGRPFLQGGNAFGTTATLGTTDANNLQIITGSGSTIRATFDTSNNLYLGNGVTAGTPSNFVVSGTGSSTAGTAGAMLTLQGGAGASATTGSVGGDIKIAGGNAGGSGNNAGGNVILQGGLDTNTGAPGVVRVRNSADSATAFQVQNAAGTSTYLDVDTTNGFVGIGTAAPTRRLHVTVASTSASAQNLLLEQTSTGDVGLELKNSANSFYVGTDTSDSNRFKISSSTAAGSTAVFGSTNESGTVDVNNANFQNATEFVSGAAGTLNSISVFINGGSASNSYSVAIYNDGGGSPNVPGTLLASSAVTNIVPNSWNTVPVSASIAATTTYWLAFNTNDTGANMEYANVADASCFIARTFASGWTTPFGACTSGTGNQQFSIYATYTISGGTDHFNTSLFSMGQTGDAIFRNSNNSATAFQVQNAAGTSTVFNVDSSNGRVGINTAAPTADLSFGVGANRVINVVTQTATNTAGNDLTVNSGQGNGTGAGGALTVQAGRGGATGTGGAATLQGGQGGTTSGAGGAVTVRGGTAVGAFAGGLATLAGGTAAATAGSNGGAVSITGAAGSTTGTGGTGGGLTLQGGNAGGSGNNTGGALSLTAGNSTGTTVGGGITLQAGTGGGSANGGTIGLTGGTGGGATRAGGAITVTGGTGNTTGLGGAVTIQGGTGGNAAVGGAVTIQGGTGGGSSANGANINLVGGVAASGGSKGLVVIDTATFSAAGTQSSAVDVAITQASIDGFGAIVLNATAANVDFTLSDPTLGASAAGRLVYVIAANGTTDFTLRANVGEGTGVEQNISMRQNTTATMIWTGTNWTAAGASSSTTLQAAYDNTLSSAGGAEIVLNNTATSNGLTVRNNATNPIIGGGLLEVQTSIGTNLFSVNNNISELVANGGAEDSTNFATNWTTLGTSTVTRNTTSGQYATGTAGVSVAAGTTAGNGVRNNLATNPATGTTYMISFTAMLASGAPAFTDLRVDYTPTGATTGTQCVSGQTLVTTGWTRITCEVTTPGTTVTNPDVLIYQAGAVGSARTFYIDNLSMTLADNSGGIPNNVQIGGGIYGGSPTLFTLDRSSAPPVANGNTTYLGSMYYDTTSGRIQCYESDGWGACGSAPDNIITLTPEYTGAVLNGSGVGTMTADFCANQAGVLTVNTTFCASGISRNYYRWTSPQSTQQTYSIYVSYKLPNTFKEFSNANTITLTALSDDTTNGTVDYQVFRSTGSAVTSCGSQTTVTTTDDTWQTVSFGGDESACGFVGGNNIIFKINVRAQNNANVYVENLDFTYLNT